MKKASIGGPIVLSFITAITLYFAQTSLLLNVIFAGAVFLISLVAFTSRSIESERIIVFSDSGVEIEGVLVFETDRSFLVQIHIDGDHLDRLIPKDSSKIVRVIRLTWSPMNIGRRNVQ